ncbi:hypothetical protein KIN20_001991 [Parelaphostrongylus tenuis]|uniref:Uncharacterized protein n=1 Tax=Parelaphostrongylus tenuis TaxID=148309 RepID=A0AAD5MDM3_PARTN|nr:hypothetical protein KIN20_001991 [Parelaphostrongylus tenuis]
MHFEKSALHKQGAHPLDPPASMGSTRSLLFRMYFPIHQLGLRLVPPRLTGRDPSNREIRGPYPCITLIFAATSVPPKLGFSPLAFTNVLTCVAYSTLLQLNIIVERAGQWTLNFQKVSLSEYSLHYEWMT